jgi:hypothetical protein
MIKNERGFALPMVLILVTALSILGMTLLGVSVSQAARTVHQEKKEQAFYIAKSGADAIASYIIDHYNPVSLDTAEITNLNAGYLEQDISLGTGTFQATVASGPNDTIVISSKGTMGKVRNQATLVLGMDEPVVTMDHAILASKNIDLKNTTTQINNGGNVAAGGSIDGSIHFSAGGNMESGYNKAFPPEIPFPNTSGWVENTLTSNPITQSGYYGSLDFSTTPNMPESFSVNIPDHKDIHIVFKNIKTKGFTIDIGGAGTGIINIYVESIETNGSFSVNNHMKKKVILHVKDSLKLVGAFNLYGILLYAPTATYTSTTGSLNLTGAMVTRDVTLTGTNLINYDASIANLIKESRKFERKNWSNS